MFKSVEDAEVYYGLVEVILSTRAVTIFKVIIV